MHLGTYLTDGAQSFNHFYNISRFEVVAAVMAIICALYTRKPLFTMPDISLALYFFNDPNP